MTTSLYAVRLRVPLPKDEFRLPQFRLHEPLIVADSEAEARHKAELIYPSCLVLRTSWLRPHLSYPGPVPNPQRTAGQPRSVRSCPVAVPHDVR